MKIFIPLLITTILLFGCGSAATQSQKDINTHNKMNYMDKQKVEQQKGIIGYWDDLDKYTISFYKKNTIDGQFTCIVSELDMIPVQLRKVGTQIIFNGTITKDAQLPPARMGGEQVFLLAELENIESYK